MAAGTAAARLATGGGAGVEDATLLFLAEEAGLGRPLKAMDRYPPLHNYSVAGKLAPRWTYLAEEVGLGRDGAAKVITKLPAVTSV